MKQKVAIVTGGASGIGKSTALVLARKGIKVVISGRREALGRQVVEEIRAQDGDAAFGATDVNDEVSIRQMIEFAVTRYGRLDLAVNNAGIAWLLSDEASFVTGHVLNIDGGIQAR